MIGGFRVQTVAIEGFKGFTTRKEIDLRGRHAFLLGQNGNGKSSIIEAIRWGLFGSTGRPNEIVANRGYAARCRVDVTLIRDGKQWNFRRTLIRGVSGGSNGELTNEQGQEQPIREIMPQLDSLNAGEGMHIIFASQSVPLRRQPEDLTPFERTVFNHLGLTHPRALLSEVSDFIESQELAEHKFGEQLTDVRDQIDRQIAELHNQRGAILGSPPWPGNVTPTVIQSENRVRTLIEDITGRPPDQSLSGVSLDGLLDNAEHALRDRRDQNQSTLESDLSQARECVATLGALYNIQEEIETQQSEAQDVQLEFNTISGDMSVDKLRNSVDEERSAADALALRRQIVENASSLLRRDRTESLLCPICTAKYSRHELESRVQHAASQLSDDIISNLTRLEARLKQAEELEGKIEGFRSRLAELEKEASKARASIDENDVKGLSGASSADQIRSVMDSVDERKSSIEAQIEDQQGWLDATRATLAKLKDEERFQEIQRTLVGCQQSRNRFGEVQRAFDNLVLFGESVRTIQQAVGTCLIGRLEEETPEVSANLTQVFAALTRHPWYDQLTIDKSKLPRLELQVASSQDALALGHPTGVLNGQAGSALELVPHFAFGQAEGAPTEVYLVLLDDPTRSFDEEHIEILVERLADLGRNVQLIVASQETARLRTLLRKNFERASYVVVEPNKWSYHDGPVLNIEYE